VLHILRILVPMYLPAMIETDFYILNSEQYQEFYIEAQKLDISIDYYLMEFCDTEGPYIYTE